MSLRSARSFAIVSLTVALAAAIARAEVGDPTLQTDHPHYAGEGVFQTPEDCVRFATANAETAQDQAIALYLWMLTHQCHLASPQEPLVPGVAPDTARDSDYEMVVYDANRGRFSYGYGLCGTVHAWNEPYWKALGMNVRRRAFPGHVNSEVEYDGSWHAFDTDMAGLIFRRDGVVAGYEDVIADPRLAEFEEPDGLPRYPFAWPGDFEVMKRGWREVARAGHWYKMYHSGYAAHPGIVHLRAGETFTRYFDRDHFGGPSKRRFWHHMEGGPFRNWTFINRGTPWHRGSQSNARGNASYCNGEFVYRPLLGGERWREGTASHTENVAQRPESPRLHSRDGEPAAVVFRHFSPYVICGDPEDDANPMTGPATGGLTVEGTAVGEVQVEVSANEGQTWWEAGPVRGRFALDLTDRVKGRYGWRLRFSWEGKSGLDDVTFTTVTQVAQAIYPRLKPEGSHVVYRAASRGVTAVLPDFGLAEAEIAAIEDVPRRSANVVYTPRGPQQSLAYRITDNKPGAVVFRIDAPAPLVEIHAAARFKVRVPPPENCDFHMEVSTDNGQTWREFARADIPSDNEYSSGWMYGRDELSGADSRSALVRVHLYADGTQTGLIDAQFYGTHQTAEPQPVTITYAWREGDEQKRHIEQITAGATEHRFRVPTGESIVDEFVRIEAAAGPPN